MGFRRGEAGEESPWGFNFWPSFADLMLSLVLILVMVVYVVRIFISAGTVNLRHVEENQESIVGDLAKVYGVEPRRDENGYFVVSDEAGVRGSIEVQNEATLQRFRFQDRILFPPNEYELSERGQKTLMTVGRIFQEHLDAIREIQIQGHADTDPTSTYPSNLDLAALRAIEVFKFLQEEVGIDPANHLMSATSYGEFKPVHRTEGDSDYSEERLQADNASTELKAQNRRIEILLFYRM